MPQEAEHEAVTVTPGPLPFVVDYDGLTAALFQRSHEPAFDDSAAGMQDARQWADELIATYVSLVPGTTVERETEWGLRYHDSALGRVTEVPLSDSDDDGQSRARRLARHLSGRAISRVATSFTTRTPWRES